MIYAGIGSRETPKDFLELFYRVGMFLGTKGILLRSGHADGADMAFEDGCDEVNGQKEIWIPWKGFNKSDSKFVVHGNEAFELASQFHPAWHRLSEGAKKLQARNGNQVLGENLSSPCEFIICWTNKGSGGTGQAIRLAKHYGITVLDVGKFSTAKEAKTEIAKLFIEKGIGIKK